MRRYTVYFIWKLLCKFRVVPPPIIRSTNNCIYSIWYLSDRYCYLPLIAAGSSNGLTDTRCCRYSCLCSWWWVVVPPETCRAVSGWNKLCNVASCWIYIGTITHYFPKRLDTVVWTRCSFPARQLNFHVIYVSGFVRVIKRPPPPSHG